MPFCSPDKIKIPTGRFRTPSADEVSEMMESIKDIGQLQPILLTNDMELIDGYCRTLCCKTLGREVWWEDEQTGRLMLNDPVLRKIAELHANIKRKDFTPAQKNTGIAELHSLMQQTHSTGPDRTAWTQEDTAKKLGLKSHATVATALAITTAIKTKAVPGIENAKTTQEAYKMVKDKARLEAHDELVRRRAERETGAIKDPHKFFGDKIILGNCLDKMRELPPNICGLFVTDPPWKIGMDKVVEDHGSALQKAVGSYDDSSDDIILLLKSVITEMYRIAKQDCWVVMFCGAKYWSELCAHFRKAWSDTEGFSVYNKPLIWVKTKADGSMITPKSPAPSIWPASVTDFMILARKGNPFLYQLNKPDAFFCPPISSQDRIHQAQKPIGLMKDIISRFYHPGTNPMLIDPFIGSGSTLVAGWQLGIKNILGWELNEQNRERAISHIVKSYLDEDKLPTLSEDIELEDMPE